MLTDFTGVKLFVGTPCYGGQLFLNYHASMLRAIAELPRLGLEICTIPAGGDSLVHRARNMLVAEFLKTDCTHLMFIDADIGFKHEDIASLIRADKDVAAGVYPKKCYPASWPMNVFSLTDAGYLPTCPETNLVEVKDAPTGFMLIQRRVIEGLIEQHPEWRTRFREGGEEANQHCYSLFDCWTDEGGMYLSEDFGFCRRAQAAGYRIWVDPRIALTHAGTHIFDFGAQADKWRMAEADIDVGIQGWMSAPELIWLYSQAKTSKRVVEIGSWKGRSTYALCMSECPDVVAVDHWFGSDGEREGPHAEAMTEDVFSEFKKNVGHFENLTAVRMPSVQAAEILDPADMVFIDAGHSYADVVADIDAWLPKTKKLICGHDYSQGFPDVMRAVLEKFGGRVQFPAGSIWAVWL